MQDDPTEQALARQLRLFDDGEISATWEGLEPLLTQTLDHDATRKRNYLQLGCALYYIGDLAAARVLNRALPVTEFTTLRYRLSLRLRDPLMAKRLRMVPDLTAQARADFATSAGLYLLWRHQYRCGFHFYQHRATALNFGRILPRKLVYAPLPMDPAQDGHHVVLEQGVGEILFCLAHLKSQGGAETKHFLAEAKYQQLVQYVFPKADFTPLIQLHDDWSGVKVHCAADYLARSHASRGTLMPQRQLASPIRTPFLPAATGICWRGGSGQNRREERRIPLARFLDMLPKEGRFVPLQFDLTKEEREILIADPRCQTPIFDITQDPLATLNMVRGLAGVISVDSANWHFAGVSGVPFLALMNKTSHWFWGPKAQAETAYPSAQTCPIEEWTRDNTAVFVRNAAKGFAARPMRRRLAPSLADRPVFILGLPRSGTSMTARIFERHGFWFGKTVQGTAENKHGFFENRALRDLYVKGILKWVGSDPVGVTPLIDLDGLSLYPHLRFQILRALGQEGYDGGVWAFKDPKLTLVWPVFAQAFPEATWVIVNRNRQAVIKSLCRTSFMARHSTDPDYWQRFAQSYEYRLERLRQSGAHVVDVSADTIRAGIPGDLAKVFDIYDIALDPDLLAQAIDPTLMHSK